MVVEGCSCLLIWGLAGAAVNCLLSVAATAAVQLFLAGAMETGTVSSSKSIITYSLALRFIVIQNISSLLF
jgi:hypothetical protein